MKTQTARRSGRLQSSPTTCEPSVWRKSTTTRHEQGQHCDKPTRPQSTADRYRRLGMVLVRRGGFFGTKLPGTSFWRRRDKTLGIIGHVAGSIHSKHNSIAFANDVGRAVGHTGVVLRALSRSFRRPPRGVRARGPFSAPGAATACAQVPACRSRGRPRRRSPAPAGSR